LICGVTAPAITSISVRDFLAIANTALGGGATGYSLVELNALTASLNGAFFAGAPSTFAQAHLYTGSCP
jgi:hypothetical protein